MAAEPVPDLARHLRPGDVLVAGQVLGEPTALLDVLFGQVADLTDLRLFVGMSLTDVWSRAPSTLHLVSTVGMPPNGPLIDSGAMELVPTHMSQLPWLLGPDGPLRTDVALVLLSPPDADGWCSLGVTSDYAWTAVRTARVVLAEVNDRVPVVAGDTRVHLDQVAAWIRTSRPLPELSTGDPSATELRIAAQVAPLVRDGTCLQVGIGKLGEALLRSVGDRRDLGLHAGMVGDTLLEMVRDGVVTGAAKRVDRGLAVAGAVVGSARAVALAGAETGLRLRAIEHTHDPATIAALPDFLCVNSALEVDLLGQVGSEVAAGRYVGAVGGSVDFLRSAVLAAGGRSVVALPASTARGRPRIVPRVQRVTALGTDVDAIATEYGLVELRGLSQGERAARLVALAAPEHREELAKAATEAGL